MSIIIDLSNQVALVTGASQGIGAEIARTLHRAGASVVLNHQDQEGPRVDAETIAAALNADRAESALTIAADVRDPEQVRGMYREVVNRFGGLDILVNNAGILRDRTLAKMSLEEWNAVIETNLSGVFHCCQGGLEVMRDGGSIVNLGSLAAEAGFHGQANYAAAKAGVHALTRVLAKECARRSIRVNAVAPGVIDTPMMDAVAKDVRQEMARSIPSGRFGTPSEVADVVLFLCSDLASYVNGHILSVNGGWRG